MLVEPLELERAALVSAPSPATGDDESGMYMVAIVAGSGVSSTTLTFAAVKPVLAAVGDFSSMMENVRVAVICVPSERVVTSLKSDPPSK